MINLEQENAKYFAQIDEVAERFRREKTYYAKEWLKKLTSPVEGDVPSGTPKGQFPLVCIWGAGQFGRDFYSRILREAGVHISWFCDNDSEKWGTEILDSVFCISPTDLRDIPDCRVIIAVNKYQREIVQQCIELGIAYNQCFLPSSEMFSWSANYLCSTNPDALNQMIIGTKDLITYLGNDSRSKEIVIAILYKRLINDFKSIGHDGTQYFIPEFPLRPNEAFIDGGAFDGDTLKEFVKHLPDEAPSNQIRYYAFECDKSNFQKLQQNARENNLFPINIYPIALWEKKEEICFLNNGTSAMVCESGSNKIQADSLDNVLSRERVTWIKMDIEGAELNALIGCASIIKKYKPRLSISVYHKTYDLYEIPRFIKKIRSDYQMILRHHSDNDCETILYAW